MYYFIQQCTWPTCEEADDQADDDDREAVEAAVPHVGQLIKSFQSGALVAEEQREETVQLWDVERGEHKAN